MTIGERIRLLREKKGLSQTEFAKRIGIPNQSLSNYEKGHRFPPNSTLVKIADFFQISMDSLLGRDEFIHSIGPMDMEEFLKKGSFTYKGKLLSERDLKYLSQTLQFLMEVKEKK